MDIVCKNIKLKKKKMFHHMNHWNYQLLFAQKKLLLIVTCEVDGRRLEKTVTLHD